MIKPHNPKIGMWKENVKRKPAKRVKPTSAMLIEKYQQQLEEDRRYRVARGIKRDRFFEARNRSNLQATRVVESLGEGWCSTLQIKNLG
jgi:hypothetical protein